MSHVGLCKPNPSRQARGRGAGWLGVCLGMLQLGSSRSSKKLSAGDVCHSMIYCHLLAYANPTQLGKQGVGGQGVGGGGKGSIWGCCSWARRDPSRSPVQVTFVTVGLSVTCWLIGITPGRQERGTGVGSIWGCCSRACRGPSRSPEKVTFVIV